MLSVCVVQPCTYFQHTNIVNWLHGIYALLYAVNFRTMIGKTVKYRDKIYQVTQWIHYRLEWFEVELKYNSGYHKFWLKESDVVVL